MLNVSWYKTCPSFLLMIHFNQRCHLVQFTCKPYKFLRFARTYGRTMQSLRIFMIFADSNLQSFHALYSNCCQFAMTPDMLHEHKSEWSVTQQVVFCLFIVYGCVYSGILYQNCVLQWCWKCVRIFLQIVMILQIGVVPSWHICFNWNSSWLS